MRAPPVPAILAALSLACASGCSSIAASGKNFIRKEAPKLDSVAIFTVQGPRHISKRDGEGRPLKREASDRIGQELLDLLRSELAEGFSKRGFAVVPAERIPAEFARLYPSTSLDHIKERLRPRRGMGSEEMEGLMKMLASLRYPDNEPGENPSPRSGMKLGKVVLDDLLARGTVDLYAPEILFDGRRPRLKPVVDKESRRRAKALAGSLKVSAYLIAETDCIQDRIRNSAEGAIARCAVWMDLYDAKGRAVWEGRYEARSDGGYGLASASPREEDHLRIVSQAMRNTVKAVFEDWDAAKKKLAPPAGS